jgi:hypothetical protein
LDAVDRVVYKLSAKWFNPSEVVRIDRRDNFRFEIGVWGTTTIETTIHLKGKQAPIGLNGFFSIQKQLPTFLSPVV